MPIASDHRDRHRHPDPLRRTHSSERQSAGGRVVGKGELTLLLRGERWTGAEFLSESDARAIEVHVANLRRKLGESPSEPRWIETVRGVGYRITAR
ncbi:MAG TPA: helix-turn-helix domain-containing protein [Microbacterium sp.]|nr:helix-turn-helix domain-containing protein [Microbacterium sp.]